MECRACDADEYAIVDGAPLRVFFVALDAKFVVVFLQFGIVFLGEIATSVRFRSLRTFFLLHKSKIIITHNFCLINIQAAYFLDKGWILILNGGGCRISLTGQILFGLFLSHYSSSTLLSRFRSLVLQILHARIKTKASYGLRHDVFFIKYYEIAIWRSLMLVWTKVRFLTFLVEQADGTYRHTHRDLLGIVSKSWVPCSAHGWRKFEKFTSLSKIVHLLRSACFLRFLWCKHCGLS